MTLGLKSSVFLVLVVSQVICKTFKIIRKPDTKKNNTITSNIDISFYDLVEASGSESTTHRFGFRCLTVGKTLTLKLTASDGNPLNSILNVSEKDKQYVKGDNFKENNVEDSKGYMCISWGGWWPFTSKEQSFSKLYLQVFSSISNINNRFLYYFSIVLNLYATVELSAYFVQNSENEIDFSSSPRVDIISNKQFNWNYNQNLNCVLTDSEYNFSGEGSFKMALLATEEEEKYFDKYLNPEKQDGGFKKNNLDILPIISFNNGKLIFSHKLPAEKNPKPSEEPRPNILV